MLIAFNKPYGVICQFSAHDKHPSLKAYLDIADIYPAGRLDTDSEGLLLLTDNGQLQATISRPGHLKKTYLAQVEGRPCNADLQPFFQGITLKDWHCYPATAKIIDEPAWLWPRQPPIRQRQTIPTTWLQIDLAEGKNRQVRRMCAAIGYPCLRLIRQRIGTIDVRNLALSPGQFLELDERLFSPSMPNPSFQAALKKPLP